MADLADLYHFYGQDLAQTPSGDVALATKNQRTIQRIIRRLMTVPTSLKNGASYPWVKNYGVGLGKRIGQALDVRGLKADILSQMLLEPDVAKSPRPLVSVSAIDNSNGNGQVTISVGYYDLSGIQQNFSFNLTGVTLLATETGALFSTETGALFAV